MTPTRRTTRPSLRPLLPVLLLAAASVPPAHAAVPSLDVCSGHTYGTYGVDVRPVSSASEVGVEEEALVAAAWQYLCNDYAALLNCMKTRNSQASACTEETYEATSDTTASGPLIKVEHKDGAGNTYWVSVMSPDEVILNYYIPPSQGG